MGGMWFCWYSMWVASANLVRDDGSGFGVGSGVGSSLQIPVFHLRLRYRRAHIVSSLPPLQLYNVVLFWCPSFLLE